MQIENTKPKSTSIATTKLLRGKNNSRGLPRYMTVRMRRNVAYYYSLVVVDGKRRELPLGPDLNIAVSQHYENARNYGLDINAPYRVAPTQAFAVSLYKKLVRNAKNRGIPVQITLDDVSAMFDRSECKCELTGIAFDLAKHSDFRVRPWVPSVDRIDSLKPYTVENCRLVCAAVNSALGQYGEEALLYIARMMMAKRRRDRDSADRS